MKAVFMGTGTSHGVPIIACDCPVCSSPAPENKRNRPSLLIKTDNGQNILIDTAPEFRLQCLRNNVRHIDAVLYTHHHNDHIAGLDDLRRFNQINGLSINCYANARTVREIKAKYRYIFTKTQEGGGKPQIDLIPVKDAFSIGEQKFQVLDIWHGGLRICGFRTGALAYITDCSKIMRKTYAHLRGLHTLIIGAVRYRPHPTHFSLEQAIEEADRIGAEKVYITHIAHNMEHHELCRKLPPHIRPAYDGLEIDIPQI